eukprot:CAMPEP_0201597004 /NCGR_PEP_ID=MMETSP0190_2-20130828/193583_1 /ASSEMBLY_ACC=CAM_ASM_000263 /TAXON_ID=37353 /ORGANISM="Rosalina sp." /LENGTH=182 /DNA_ID=CAMNT_0048057711 /DNA_START=33 /DNA_END=581 /DNA_ORIENTATION=+
MGSWLSQLKVTLCFGAPPSKEFRMLLLGLDSAGKTTILRRLTTGEKQSTKPTIGFTIETIQFDNLHFYIWDVGGQEKLRALWRRYYVGTQGIIFVVDAADIDRLPIAKEEIHELMHEYELQYAVMAILANKQDLDAYNKHQLSKELELSKLGKKYQVFETCATTGEGLDSVMNWLSRNMEEI